MCKTKTSNNKTGKTGYIRVQEKFGTFAKLQGKNVVCVYKQFAQSKTVYYTLKIQLGTLSRAF